MSFDGGSGIAMISQPSLVQGQLATPDAALAQQFEEGLRRASETSAIASKQMDESQLRAAEVGDRERQYVSEVVEVRVTPQPNSPEMQEKLVGYLDAFHQRTNDFSGMMVEARASIGKDGASGESIGGMVSSDVGSASQLPGIQPNDLEVAMHMLERSFSFAIETTLVSKASTESTRVFNNLLKGQ